MESLLEIDSPSPTVISPPDLPGLTGAGEESGSEVMTGEAPSFSVFLAVSMPAQPMTIMMIKAMTMTAIFFKCICDSFLLKAF